MQRIFLIIALLFILPAMSHAEEIHEVDTNGDGKADQWFFRTNSLLVKLEEDFDFDGKVDKRALFFYQNGQKTKVEIDSNMDGKADGWSYHKNNKRYRIESDTNYDGKADYIIDNQKNITLIDSDYNGQMDIQERGGKRLIDLDGDGTFETEEANKLNLENWLKQNRPEYSQNLQQYMHNTNYKKKSGLE